MAQGRRLGCGLACGVARTFIISFCIACIVFLMSPTLTRRFIAPMTSVLFTMCPITFCCAAGGTPTALSGVRQ